MPEIFPVYQVPEDGDDRMSEQMGSKRKFWYRRRESQRQWLFKYSRENTGEHWSEKVACELAQLLGLPHANVELARQGDAWGAIVEDVRADRERTSLLHGNELLLELDPSYPMQGGCRVSEHTVARVARALDGVLLPDLAASLPALPRGVDDALGLFVGYLFLDAIIGNTDRHHENWAVVVSNNDAESRRLHLSPTYDHASSLGRELSDDQRRARLRGKGAHGIEGYASAHRARSAFYADEGHRLSPREAFRAMGKLRPAAHLAWISRCKQLDMSVLREPIDRLPQESASPQAAEFARVLIEYNRDRLLEFAQEHVDV